METCGLSCIKYLLFFFNLIFSLAGIGLIVVGSVMLSYADNQGLNSEGKGSMIAMIVVGSFIFVTTFLGCCGAIKENNCMLISFAVVLLIVFIAQLSIGIEAAVYKYSNILELKGQLKSSLKLYNDEKTVKEAWAKLQTNFKCCGVDSLDDWKDVLIDNVPASCCPLAESKAADKSSQVSEVNCKASKAIYKEGCYEKLKMTVINSHVVIVGVAIGMAFIELVGVILACILAKNVRKESEA